MQERLSSRPAPLVTVSVITAGWALWYAIYRAYYGFGGTVGMFGTPVSEAQWRGINLAGAALLLGVAVLPVAVLPAKDVENVTFDATSPIKDAVGGFEAEGATEFVAVVLGYTPETLPERVPFVIDGEGADAD